VRDSDTRSYFKVPQDWVVEDAADAAGDDRDGDAEPADERVRWFVTFRADGAEDADSAEDEEDAVEQPAGAAQVLQLTAAARETINFDGLNGLFYEGFNDGLEDGTVAIDLVSDVRHLDGFRGRRLVYTIRGDAGRLTIDQTTLLDNDTRNLYAFMIRCTAECYDDHRTTIDNVVASWTVKER
jgi:hypothetical protein